MSFLQRNERSAANPLARAVDARERLLHPTTERGVDAQTDAIPSQAPSEAAPPSDAAPPSEAALPGHAPPAATELTPMASPQPAMPSVARLEKVSAVEAWGSDPRPILSWLAENIGVVGETIGVDLHRADGAGGLAPDGHLSATDDDRNPVAVVVTLGPSTDERLGGLLRHVVATGVKTAVWVVAEIDVDHVSSISWLNRVTDVRFFIVRLEAARIGSSATAPVLTTLLRGPRAGDSGAADAVAPVLDGEPGRRAEDGRGSVELLAEDTA